MELEEILELSAEKLVNMGYKSYMEYLNDELIRAEWLVNFYYYCIAKKNKKNTFLTEVESSAELANSKIFDKSKYEKIGKYIDIRLKNRSEKDDFIAAEYIKFRYKLNNLEWFSILVGILNKDKNKIEKLFSKCYGKDFKLDFSFVIKIYCFVENAFEIEHYFEIEKKLTEKMQALCFDNNEFILDDRLYKFIMSNAYTDTINKEITVIYPGRNEQKEELIVHEDIAQKVYSLINNEKLSDSELYFYLHGDKGSGKKTIVKRIAQVLDKSLILLDLRDCCFDNEHVLYNSFISAFREAFLNYGYLCIENFEILEKKDDSDKTDYAKYIKFLLHSAQRYSNFVFILTNKNMNLSEFTKNLLWLDVPLPKLSKFESIKVWRHYLKEFSEFSKQDIAETANKFLFTPGQIAATANKLEKLKIWKLDEEITKSELSECAYSQIINSLFKNATLIKAKHDWNDLILAEREKTMLKNACAQIKYKHIVYDKWGMNKRILYGRGVSMLFEGAPGTGKTMAAQVIAKELALQIYKVDLSQIISKYIGETEKKLNDIFDEAKKSNVILLFDETDALFGKRTAVKDSRDKNANIETSYLLQKMEEYDGVTIMTTNFLENIDKAFFRRISYVIHFAFPDVQARKEIWFKIFPESVPLSKKINLDYLAGQFEISGGSIKNIAVVAAFLAASEKSSKISFKHVLLAIKYELKKQGKMLLKNDFGEYGYLLD